MHETRCNFFTFLSGSMYAAIIHFACAAAFWCSPVFFILPVVLFFIETDPQGRVACMHTVVISLIYSVIAAIPIVLWLILKGITHMHGTLFIIGSVLFIAVMLILAFLLVAIEVTCGVKTMRGERVSVPVVTDIVAAIAKKMF